MKAFHTTKVKPKMNSHRNIILIRRDIILIRVMEIKARTNKNGAMVS